MQTALAAATKRPALTVTCEDHIQHFASYQTPAGGDALNAACIAADNSIVRCYVSRQGFTSTINVQRITDPTVAAQWTPWTALAFGNGNCFQDGGAAISKWPDNSLHIYVQQGTGGNAIWNWYSTDNGVTWAGPGVIASPPGGALCKGIGSAGNNDVFFLYDVFGGEAMGCCIYSAGAWSAIKTWPYAPLQAGNGLAPVWVPAQGHYYIPHSDGYGLYAVYFDGVATWNGTPTYIAPATSTAIGRLYPTIFYDASSGLYSLTVCEYDSGFLTGTVYQYPRVRQSFDLVHWSNGFILHPMTAEYGATLLSLPVPYTGSAGARTYIVTMYNIFSAPMYSQANTAQYLDISNAILSYTRHEQIGKAAKLTLLLDNASGQYNALINVGNGGPYTPIGKNTTIKLSEGYYTGTPPITKDVVLVGTYRISNVVFERTPEANYILIVADDMTKNLDLESRYQMTYTNQTLLFLVQEVCARGGIFSFAFNANIGTQQTQVIPTFTLKAGQTYRKALNELCQTYGLVYFLEQNETLFFTELTSGDPSIWSYTPEWEVVHFGTAETRSNHIIVSGKPPVGGQVGSLTIAEAYDDVNARDTNIERLIHYVDSKLVTVAECQLKANFLLAQEQRSQTVDSFVVPNNPALMLADVVTITDGAAHGSGQSGKVRLDGITVRYDAQKAEYSLTASAEGV